MSIPRNEESTPAVSDTVITQEMPVGPNQYMNLQHTRAESVPLLSSENPAQVEQYTSQSLRHSTQFPILDYKGSADFQNRDRRSVKRQASYSTTGSTRLKRDRESILELAAFLKNREPPADHFMSIPESIDTTTTQTRSLPFKMFRRQNSKKGSLNPRHMRLPDSAVAAKTISGKWHIAISIPLEHDHMPEPRSIQPCPEQEQTNCQTILSGRTGPIVVLKPVVEAQELPKPIRVDSIIGARDSSSHPPLKHESFSSAINAEDTRALLNYYRQQTIQDLASKFEDSPTNPARPALLQKDLVAPSPVNSRRQSQRTEYRQSGGTIYSDVSLITDNGLSRGPSSSSSSPSASHFISMNGTDSGRRLSGAAKRQKKGTSFASSIPLRSNYPTPINSPNPATFHVAPSVASIESDISSAQLSKADTAQGYTTSEIAGVQVSSIRNVARMPGPAPTRKLPDLPEGSDDSRSRSKSNLGSPERTIRAASTKRNDSEVATAGSGATSPVTPAVPEVVKSLRQLRQEKVKALRSRDMAALKAKTNYPQAIAASLAKGNKIAADTPKVTKHRRASISSRQSKRRSTPVSQSPQDQLFVNMDSSLTPVMVVANIEPPFDDFYFPSPPRSPPRKSSRRSYNRISIGRAPTPPRSVTPSLASSDDDTLHLPRRASTARSLRTHGNIQSGSGSGRATAPVKEAKEHDMEARMKRLERSNTMMLQTLSAVVQMGVGFKELQKLLPVPGGDGAGLRDGSGGGRLAAAIQMRGERNRDGEFDRGLIEMMGRGMDDLEPLMRELHLAARVSQEAEREGVI